eukprot:1958005-Prymnesium_polylepis.1
MGHRPSCVPVVLRYYDITCSSSRPLSHVPHAEPRSARYRPRAPPSAIGHVPSGSRNVLHVA